MTYRGRVQNGVVVLDVQNALEEGTLVRVQPEEQVQLDRGSSRSLLDWRTRWAGPIHELDALLAEVQAMRDSDLT